MRLFRFGILYRFEKPETVSVYEEYYATTFIDVVGIVGGTLGLFIGFAFYDTILLLFDYFLMLLEKIKAFRSWMKSRNPKKSSPSNKKPSKKLTKKPKVVQNKIQDVSKTPSPNTKTSPTSNGPPKKPRPGQNEIGDVPKNFIKKPEIVQNKIHDVSKDPSPNQKDPTTSNGPTKKPKPGQTKVGDVPKPKEVDVKDPNAIQNVPA